MTDERADATIRLAIGGDDAAIAVGGGERDGHRRRARMVVLAALLTSRVDWVARADRLAIDDARRQVVAISALRLWRASTIWCRCWPVTISPIIRTA